MNFWGLLNGSCWKKKARAGTENARVELTAEDILEHLQLAERHRANAEAARLALLARADRPLAGYLLRVAVGAD